MLVVQIHDGVSSMHLNLYLTPSVSSLLFKYQVSQLLKSVSLYVIHVRMHYGIETPGSTKCLVM